MLPNLPRTGPAPAPSTPRGRRLAASLAVLAAVVVVAPSTARAQVPEPDLPEVYQRSGLIGRFIPVRPSLPGDPKRDNWYDTRWGDPPNERKHPNFYPNGGMYGLPWRADSTMSFYPYFYGAPGQSTLSEKSRPWPRPFRLAQTLTHPFKPVGVYYDQGSYVPIYDLDPLVPGPGPWPIPFFRPITRAGG